MGIVISFQNKIKVKVRLFLNIFILTFLTILNVLPQVNEVADGVIWTQATGSAQFPARYSHTSVVFNDKMWIIGGAMSIGDLNDVWYSKQQTSANNWKVYE